MGTRAQLKRDRNEARDLEGPHKRGITALTKGMKVAVLPKSRSLLLIVR
jgi:hypothetical protein